MRPLKKAAVAVLMLAGELLKAGKGGQRPGHKYLRRERITYNGKPAWRYTYQTPELNEGRPEDFKTGFIVHDDTTPAEHRKIATAVRGSMKDSWHPHTKAAKNELTAEHERMAEEKEHDGKVIGRTKSGKPIYWDSHRRSTAGWSTEDHEDTADAQRAAIKDSDPKTHGTLADYRLEHAAARDYHRLTAAARKRE